MDRLIKRLVIALSSLIFLSICIVGLFFYKRNNKNDTFLLHDFTKIADNLNEWVEPDNRNIAHPTYNSYYALKYKRGFIHTLNEVMTNFYHQSHKKVTADLIVNFLDIINNKNVKHFEIVQHSINEQTKIIFIGGIRGAFHSFVRILNQLISQNILSEDLILKPNNYIILVGDVINRSAFMVETLFLTLQLIKNNPEQILFTKGRVEEVAIDDESLITTELEYFAPSDVKNLQNKINIFFAQLPLAGVFKYRDQTFPDENFVLFTHASPELTNNASRVAELLALTKPDVVVKTVKNREHFIKTRGLWKVSSGELIEWAVFSNNTWSARKALNFNYDSFSIVSKDHNKWLIQLFARDMRDSKSQFSTEKFNLLDF